MEEYNDFYKMGNSPQDLIAATTTQAIQQLRSTIFKDIAIIVLVLIAALAASAFSGNLLVVIFLIVAVTIVTLFILVLFFIVFFYGMFRGRPELLRFLFSEEHIYKMTALERLGDEKHEVPALNSGGAGKNNPALPPPSENPPGKDLPPANAQL